MMANIGHRLRRLGRLVAREPADEVLLQATSPTTKIAQRQLQLSIRTAMATGVPLPPARTFGFRVFSQDDEDGLILFLLAVVGVDRGRFVDIGAGDCTTASNCANLAFNLGFHGVFVEADPARIERGRAVYARQPDTRAYPPKFVQAFVTGENVNDVIRGAGIEGEIDVLSIDIDGNDHWIWRAIDCVTPKIVVIETHTEHMLEDVSSPYRPDFDWRDVVEGEPIGASPTAMVRFGAELGYRLVGSNRYGFNAVFLREDLAVGIVQTVGAEDLLGHDWSRESA